MSAEIIDGKAVAAKVREEVKREVDAIDRKPGLATILVATALDRRPIFGGELPGEMCANILNDLDAPREDTQHYDWLACSLLMTHGGGQRL